MGVGVVGAMETAEGWDDVQGKVEEEERDVVDYEACDELRG